MQHNMLNIERVRSNFFKMCQSFTRKFDSVNKNKVSGDAITGLAEEFAEQNDFMTGIIWQKKDMKQLN